MANILVVDDEPKMTSLVCGHLEDEGHRVTTTVDPSEALELIIRHSFDIVITDLSMPKISGMVILEKALEKEGTGVIMMTAYGTVETAVLAMKKGAADYLLKPFSLEELSLTVGKITERQKLASLAGHYAQVIRDEKVSELIGSSPALEKVKKLLAQVAATNSTVLLTGRSGTGKELAARMIHNLSKRGSFPFIAVNCAAITETLLESELFGHEKGSFTGAVARKRGRFELAEKGTIFLDEIGEMSPGMQSKLLRVLEERQLVRVGGVDTIDIDVRLLAATNRNLKEDIRNDKFREDLYFRLNVFPIELPLLVERGEDVIELAEHFLKQMPFQHYKLDSSVKQILLDYDWPGNIRELKNVLERAVILSGGEPLTVAEFSLDKDDAPLGKNVGASKSETGLDITEREMILEALKKAGGNKTKAAEILKISRRRLYSRMKIHDIKV
ncbi:MAG: sigma-54-dependent Fis family transcriptional regulator [candidate division Zixibacteria bacterium]|nr:sigma-54-dependent Fis family transcriptional regulator [candidate division Zixibacteria bacterium]